MFKILCNSDNRCIRQLGRESICDAEWRWASAGLFQAMIQWFRLQEITGQVLMESAEYWRALFDHWPENIERRGSILTKQGEAISFTGFLISAGILYTERSAPDASGNRKAFMSWEQIALVKLPTTMPIDEFLAMGFREAKGKPVGKPTGKSTGKSGT